MPVRLCLAILLMCISLCLAGQTQAAPPAPAAPSPATVEGLWVGALHTGGVSLRLAFRITAKQGGGYASTLDSLDQGAHAIPVQTTTLSGAALTLSLPNMDGQFVGTLSVGGKTLTGTWTQGAGSLPLVLVKTDTLPPPPRRPQEPQTPFPYAVRDVVYPNTAGGVVLAGTLSVPHGAGPFPAAILLTGSGSHDRDETLFGHKPFWVIADYLTRRGIAVLRVDDRGVGGSTGSKMQSNDHDFAGDARAGIAYLQAQPEINPREIGLVGHSEGGLIAPLAAARNPNVAFVVLLAGPGVPGPLILREQGALLLKSQGASPALVAWAGRQQAQMLHIIQTTPDNAQAKTKLDALTTQSLAHLPAEMQPHAAEYRASAAAQQATMLSPWYRGFLQSRPAAVLAQVHCPVLALGGSKDVQVPAAESLRAIAAALRQGGNTDVTVRELPGLNHLFQTAPTGAIGEYAQLEETFAPVALKLVGDWITHRTRASTPRKQHS